MFAGQEQELQIAKREGFTGTGLEKIFGFRIYLFSDISRQNEIPPEC